MIIPVFVSTTLLKVAKLQLLSLALCCIIYRVISHASVCYLGHILRWTDKPEKNVGATGYALTHCIRAPSTKEICPTCLQSTNYPVYPSLTVFMVSSSLPVFLVSHILSVFLVSSSSPVLLVSPS